MSPIIVIAKNTFREIIRDRILYGIVVFALLLISLSLALGELSFAEQARISANFGFAGIHVSACILSVFVGSSLVSKEIEKQTILTLLARPITRLQFLLGKFAGLVSVIVTVTLGLSLVLACIMIFLDLAIESSFFIALLGVFLEALILIAVTLLFGTFSRPIMTVIFSGSIFLIGHWVGSLEFFSQKSESAVFKLTALFVRNLLPDFEKLNWRAAPIYSDSIPFSEVASAVAYSSGWILILMTVTSIIFRRRDFV